MEYQEVLNRKQPPQTFYDAVEYAVAYLHQHHQTGNIEYPSKGPRSSLSEAFQLLIGWLMVHEPEGAPRTTVTIRGEGWSL